MDVYDPHVYPGSTVLINYLGITSSSKLLHAENAVSTAAALRMANLPPHTGFNLDHLCWIHRGLFGELYAWAGETRTTNIPGTPERVAHEHIEEFAETLFLKLHDSPLLREHRVGDASFLDESAQLLHGLNVLHPFRDGNGRTHRIFLNTVAMRSGRFFDWSRIPPELNVDASLKSATQGPRRFRQMLKKALVSAGERRFRCLLRPIR